MRILDSTFIQAHNPFVYPIVVPIVFYILLAIEVSLKMKSNLFLGSHNVWFLAAGKKRFN